MTARPAAYIVAARRTPIGKFMGGLARVPAPTLGSYVAKALFEAVPGAKDHIDECIMGNVLQAGVGQNPARQVAIQAGLPETISAVTVNKVCGSGLQAVMQAAQSMSESHAAGVGETQSGVAKLEPAPAWRHVHDIARPCWQHHAVNQHFLDEHGWGQRVCANRRRVEARQPHARGKPESPVRRAASGRLAEP